LNCRLHTPAGLFYFHFRIFWNNIALLALSDIENAYVELEGKS